MAIESDQAPPPQVAFYNNPRFRAYGYQLVLLAVVLWLGTEFVINARENLAAQNITSGFGFLEQTAGFGVSQSLIPYNETDSYGRVFLVGLLNTLLVAGLGIVFATVLGFVDRHRAAVAQLAGGADRRRLCRTRPQPAAAVSNPVLVSRGARYAAGTAPELRRCSADCSSTTAASSCRGPVFGPGAQYVALAVVVALVLVLAIRSWARRRQDRTGQTFPMLRRWPRRC